LYSLLSLQYYITKEMNFKLYTYFRLF